MLKSMIYPLQAKKKPRQIEHNIQAAICQYLKIKENLRKDFIFFAVPNGGWRNEVVAAKLKKEGVRAGVSDLILVFKGAVYFVELKTDKGKQSPFQKIFQQDVERLGYKYLLWRSIDDCTDFFASIERK